MGVLSGVVGAAFVQANIRLRHFRRRFMAWGTPRRWIRTAEVRQQPQA